MEVVLFCSTDRGLEYKNRIIKKGKNKTKMEAAGLDCILEYGNEGGKGGKERRRKGGATVYCTVLPSFLSSFPPS